MGIWPVERLSKIRRGEIRLLAIWRRIELNRGAELVRVCGAHPVALFFRRP